jgi:hypothetical protein
MISIVASLFNVMDWHMNSVLLLLTSAFWVLGSFTFCISGMVEVIRGTAAAQRWIAILGSPLVLASAVFILLSLPLKVLHWAEADLFLLLTTISILLAFPLLLLGAFMSRKSARLSFVQSGLVAMLLTHSGMALNALYALGSVTKGDYDVAHKSIRQDLFTITGSRGETGARILDEIVHNLAGRQDTASLSIVDRAHRLHEAADRAYSTLDNLYDEMVEASGRVGTDPATGRPEPSNLRDRDTPLFVMIESGRGAELKDTLLAFRERALSTCAVPEKEITLHVADPPPRTGTQRTWEEDNFADVPMVAALAVIAKLQNDVRTTEVRVLECLKAEMLAMM